MRTRYKLSILTICLALGLSVFSNVSARYLAQQGTPPVDQPLVTSTPAADGTLVHIVAYGQTLITIAQAYQVSLNDLKGMNGLTSDDVYEGQKLIIRLGATATIAPSPTRTAAPTRTATVTRAPGTATPRPTLTPRPTQTPNAAQRFLNQNASTGRQKLGFGIVAACLVGLMVVGLTGFRKA